MALRGTALGLVIIDCDCQLDMQLQTWTQRLDRPHRLRAQLVHCALARSVELFMLGELNCAKSSAEHPSVIAEITAIQSLSQLEARENPLRNPRSARLAGREGILTTSCGCTYPTLAVEKRLASTALFIQRLSRARFPGTATAVTAPFIITGSQSQSDQMSIMGSGQSRNNPALIMESRQSRN